MSKEEHDRLCKIGEAFLKRPLSANGHGCHFAIREAAVYGENPDVFGIRHGHADRYDTGTIVLEAKTSRGDFLNDKKKPFRIDPDTGMGRWRYYICPEGLILPAELPPRWGLLYVNKQGHIKPIWGAIAIPKKTYQNSDGTNRKFIPIGAAEEYFLRFAFAARNIQHEQNLLAMALTRLGDPEELLYKQRDYNRLESKLFNKEQKIHDLERELSNYRLKELRHTLKNKP